MVDVTEGVSATWPTTTSDQVFRRDPIAVTPVELSAAGGDRPH
jgi:hypothetical protein